jgi:hypothetical protein
MYVCRYLPAVKPLVSSKENYFTLRGRGGFLALEDTASLQIAV